MFTSPDYFVQAEIDRRLELTSAYQWHRPLKPQRHFLRDLFGRHHHTPRARVLPA